MLYSEVTPPSCSGMVATGAQLQELILSQLVYNLLSHFGAQTVTKCLPLPSPSNLVSGMVNHSLCPGSNEDTLNPPPLSPTAPPNHKVTALSPPKDFFCLIHQLCSCSAIPCLVQAQPHLISAAPHLIRTSSQPHLISAAPHLSRTSSQRDGILSASVSLLLLLLPFNLWKPGLLQSMGSPSQTRLRD